MFVLILFFIYKSACNYEDIPVIQPRKNRRGRMQFMVIANICEKHIFFSNFNTEKLTCQHCDFVIHACGRSVCVEIVPCQSNDELN